ncbi:ERF family protein [Anaeromusa acidaminophila]|uniref:ERF family protein n=1 Tax=Anaeromusa acidaminophila TaxID=81464 RepID=UPI00036DD79B|nr:ERF family protein [Anaeromusa acidaminophila]
MENVQQVSSVIPNSGPGELNINAGVGMPGMTSDQEPTMTPNSDNELFFLQNVMSSPNMEKFGAGVGAKLLVANDAISNVPKTGYNSHFNYAYAEIDDIKNVVNPALRRAKLISQTLYKVLGTRKVKTFKGNVEYQIYMESTFRVIDPETTEYIDYYGYGCGQDAGERLLQKAQTSALKYAMTNAFNIPMGNKEEVESDNNHNQDNVPTPFPQTSRGPSNGDTASTQVASSTQVKMLMSKMESSIKSGKSTQEQMEQVLAEFGVNSKSLDKLKKSDVPAVLNNIPA